MKIKRRCDRRYPELRRLADWFLAFDIFTHAASASFFIITSLFPMMMLIFSVVSHIPWAEEAVLVDGIVELLPDALHPFFLPILQELQISSHVNLSFTIVVILWIASACMVGVQEGLNKIAGIRDNRNYLLKRVICSAFMLLLVGALMLTLILRGFGHMLLALFQKYMPYLGEAFAMVLEFHGLTLFAVIAVILAMMYAFFPHKKMKLLAQFPGAIAASAGWVIFSKLYSVYVEYALSTSVIYGSLGMIVMAMLWVYFCMTILFLGAILNQCFEKWMQKKANPSKIV